MYYSCLRNVCTASVYPYLRQYKDKIAGLLKGFEKRFQVFSKLTVREFDLPVDIQLEKIDLLSNVQLKDKFSSVGLNTFYQYLLPSYTKLTALGVKLLCMFRTTNRCNK